MSRGYLLASLALVVGAHAAQARVRSGTRARFLGWHPDSTEFAYAFDHRFNGKPVDRVHHIKRVDRSGRAKGVRFDGGVPERVLRLRFVIQELPGRRTDRYTQRFRVDNALSIRVALDVRSTGLGYSVWRDFTDDRPAERIIGGAFKEVWTEFDARVYRSPDGRWLAIVLRMATPYAEDAWVEGVRTRRL